MNKNKWEYGEKYKQFPIENGIAIFENGSKLKTHDIMYPLPRYMMEADCIFVDPPWSKGNLSTFYTKADKMSLWTGYEEFYSRLFECIKQINPKVCYVEIGKEYLDRFISEMRKIYKYVTFYVSSYYHKKENICFVVRGSNVYKGKPKLDFMDEENIIEWVCANENYSCIGDLCMGQGLVAINAAKAGRRFVGTELNHKRLSVTLSRLVEFGMHYDLEV